MVSINTFASQAPAMDPTGKPGANAGLKLTSVAQSASAKPLKDAIDKFGAPPSKNYYTNWDAGLAQVGDGYDVVLFLTDGDPTTYGNGGVTTNGSSNIRTVEESIHSANKVKATGAQVIAVGIGSGVSSDDSKQRLELISGTNDFFTSGFDTLGKELTNLATKDCNGTVTVVKSIQDGPGDPTCRGRLGIRHEHRLRDRRFQWR